MKYNRLIMFCDYGLDDAIATLHILDRADMFAFIDIVPIGGNVSVETAYRNAHTLLSAAEFEPAKVRIVDTRGIAQCAADIPDVHGSDGIGDVLPARQSAASVVGFEDFRRELDEVKQPSRDCVLSLGPCTLPVELAYVPFCTLLMGGTVNEPPNCGDYEFNEAMDVPAFAKLAAAATAVATLDTCHNKAFGFETFRSGNALCDRLIDKYIGLCKARNAPVSIYDYVAARAVTDPELFDVQRIRRPDGVEFNLLFLKKK